MSRQKGEVRAALEAEMAAGKPPVVAAKSVFERGIGSGDLRTLQKYASHLALSAKEPVLREAALPGRKDCNLPKPALARFRVAFSRGSQYVVVDPTGAQVGAATSLLCAQERAERLNAEADGKAKRGPRACLCCGKGFESEGIHNRLCAICRTRDDALVPYGYAGAGDGRKPRKSAGA